jgi:Arc/MetJ-type ribon-helix-helix transcriptional regulator
MTIHLPTDLERSIETAVQNGRFASIDDAMAEAARRLLRDLDAQPPTPPDNGSDLGPDPLLGCMREDAALMDEIVAETYRQRHDETWRDLDL